MAPLMVSFELPRSAEACYRAFCDVSLMKLWVPDLKLVRVVRKDERERPVEVYFESGGRHSYALVYAFDDTHLKLRWVPSAGVRDGVSGRASFLPLAHGCHFTYALDGLRAGLQEHETEVATAFAQWIIDG